MTSPPRPGVTRASTNGWGPARAAEGHRRAARLGRPDGPGAAPPGSGRAPLGTVPDPAQRINRLLCPPHRPQWSAHTCGRCLMVRPRRRPTQLDHRPQADLGLLCDRDDHRRGGHPALGRLRRAEGVVEIAQTPHIRYGHCEIYLRHHSLRRVRLRHPVGAELDADVLPDGRTYGFDTPALPRITGSSTTSVAQNPYTVRSSNMNPCGWAVAPVRSR